MGKTAIFTIIIGEKHPIYLTCTKTKIAYSEKINSDFIIVTEPRYLHMCGAGSAERYLFRDLLHDYDRVLYLDGDVMVNPNAPDIFEVFPDENYGYMHDQGWNAPVSNGWSGHYAPKVPDWRLNSRGLREYFNVGTMLFSKPQREQLFDKIDGEELRRDDPPGREQTYLNYMIQKTKTPMIDIGTTWNKMDYDQRDPNLSNANRRNANFIHYAGGGFGGKMDRVMEDFNIWYPNDLPEVPFPCTIVR